MLFSEKVKQIDGIFFTKSKGETKKLEKRKSQDIEVVKFDDVL